MPTIHWNPEVKLIISDVDETVADNFTTAVSEMITELTTLLEESKVIFFISGASLKRIKMRITDHIPPPLRKNILVGHCSGVEVWGFQESGEVNEKPFYSLYEGALTEDQRKKWREIIHQLIEEFKLKTYEPMTAIEFKDVTNGDPLSVILEDRGPQITFEFINGYDLSEEQEKELEITVPETHGAFDLRIPVLERADELLQVANIPVSPRLAGTWAVDFAIKGVNKTTAVRTILENDEILKNIGLFRELLADPSHIEVWGDKFSELRGGTDRHICEALPKDVRAIDFREEDPEEFMKGYNTVVWDGQKHLHEGLLEYLQLR